MKLPASIKQFLLALLGALSLIAVTAPAARAQEPIVFIHGYAGGNYNWDTMVNRFIASGYPASKLYRFSYNSYVVSNETAASQLKTFINNVRANNNNVQVSVIAHSNGGLVTRWYKVKLGDGGAIRRFITLGTPHKGSTSAYSCNYYNIICAEMTPGSSFLTSLGAAGCDRSLWSSNDGMVTPATNATCGTGTNIQVASVSHMSLLTDLSVYNVVRQQLP
jgi:triacylglycerol lipase